MDLIYYPDDRPGITRRRCGKGFSFFDCDGARITDPAERARLKALAVPPAYEQVWMSPHPNGHLLATGRDARRRKQYRYHPDWTAARAATKFDRLAGFAQSLPALRRWIADRLKGEVGERDTALAAALALIDRGALRAGTPEYAAENQSYGATTLLSDHVRVDGSSIRLDYTAKGGREVTRRLRGERLAEVLEESADLPGAELLTWLDEAEAPHRVRTEALNTVLEAVCGNGVTAKTLRTWHGTHAAFLSALEARPATIKRMSEAAAERLQNTPAIARSSYIHPRVIALSEKSEDELDARLETLGPAPDGLRRGEAELAAFLGG
ncbi:MAG: DNA topoisomerase IB [Oceanicaulis sp.]